MLDASTDEAFPWLTFRYGGRFNDRFIPTKKSIRGSRVTLGDGDGEGKVSVVHKSTYRVIEMTAEEVLGLYNSAPSASEQYAVLDSNTGVETELKPWLIGQNLQSRDEDREFTVKYKGKERPMTASEIEKVVLTGALIMLKSETGGWETNRDQIFAHCQRW